MEDKVSLISNNQLLKVDVTAEKVTKLIQNKLKQYNLPKDILGELESK